MTKKYWTSLTRDYVADWNAANAVREVLQNFLDSPAPFEYDLSGTALEFTNKGITLHQSTILMGSSSKRDDVNSVGGKGEGYKIACLVLIREGYNVTIYNGGKIWTPVFEYHEDYETEAMVFIEEDRVSNDGNLTFEISGTDDSLVEEIVEQCLYLQKDLGTMYTGERGRVLVDKVGKLYVGGLYVCDITGHKYSFDFAPKYLPLNRDRKSVDSWSLAANVTKLLEEVLPATECAKLVNDRLADAGGYYSSFTSDEVAEEVYNLVKKSFGNTVVVCEDYDEKEKLEKRGFKNVEIVYNSNQRKLVQKAPSYQEFLEELEQVVDAVEPEDMRTPIEMLESWASTFSFEYSCNEVSFNELLDLFRKRGVSFDA